MDVLITTILKRPYVFCFLAAFLFLGIRHMGLAKTLVWLVVGYSVAFLSEYSSIHNGFPYGEYHYIYENLTGEWLFAGVPVWDSASYAFLSYAGYSTAVFAFGKKHYHANNVCHPREGGDLPSFPWKIWLTGAALTLVLDIITDPVANLGKQWFLGEIYYYANPGSYFGVPVTNFIGWYLTAAAIIGVNLLIWKILPSTSGGDLPAGRHGGQGEGDRVSILHPIFYLSIALFSTAIAFWIGAYLLGALNLGITLLVASWVILIKWRALLPKPSEHF